MMLLILGVPLTFVGAVAFTRGLIYTLRPEGPRALKRREKNIDKGLPSDMRYFGKRVRRFGFLCLIIGVGCLTLYTVRALNKTPVSQPPGWSDADTAPAETAPTQNRQE